MAANIPGFTVISSLLTKWTLDKRALLQLNRLAVTNSILSTDPETVLLALSQFRDLRRQGRSADLSTGHPHCSTGFSTM